MDFLGTATPYMNQPMVQQPIYQNPMTPNPNFNYNQQQVVNNQPQPQKFIDPRYLETPKITMNSSDGEKTYIPNFANIGKVKVEQPVEKKEKRQYNRKKELVEVGKPGEIIRSKEDNNALSGTVEDVPTAYTYAETTGMLRETLSQIDAISSELVQEFANIRASRTMKNKYMALTNISDNLGSLLSSKIAAIREINSSISKSNDLDYKKYKDIKAAQGAMDDDKYIADLYKAFITNPNAQIVQPQMPTIPDAMTMGSGIIRANVDKSGSLMGGDLSYMNYMSNLTPEQNLMMYENNPNVKQVVVYDHSTGNKFFQMMDVSTGQVIPNVPVYDTETIDDLYLDLNKGIAKSININETFPIVEINKDNVKAQY